MLSNHPVIILGAGCAGLTAAVQLVRGRRGVVVVEREHSVGGLALTGKKGDCSFDLGPHAFHSKADDADEIFKEFSKNGYKKIYMRANLFLQGNYYDYPLKFAEAFFRLNRSLAARIVFDYLTNKIKNCVVDSAEDSFEAWGIKRYGKTMYDIAFGTYSSKVWGMPTRLLHKKLAEQKLPDMSFWELVKEAIGGKGAKQKILYSSYYYPQGGIGTVFEEMAGFCSRRHGEILKDCEISKINLRNSRAHSIEITSLGKPFEIDCSHIISTIPIPDLINRIYPQPKEEVVKAASQLVYRGLILVLLEVDLDNVTNQIMVYLIDRDFIFNRIGEQKNIDATMVPKGKTLLTLEICSDENGRLWNATDEELFSLARADLSKLKSIPEDKINNYLVRRVRQAYPIYDLKFDKNLNIVMEYLFELENILPAGRQGLFINNDIHDSMQMGVEVSRHVIAEKVKSEWNRKIKSFLDWRLG